MGRSAFHPIAIAFALSGCAPHSAPATSAPPSEPPGTVKEIASAGALTDVTTGDSFVKLDDAHPARLALTGAERFQVDFRLAFAGDAPAAAVLVVNANDTPVQAYKLVPRATGAWKEGLKASAPTGFFVEVPAGAQQWELRLRGGSGLAGGVRIVPSAKARSPLAATAPVLVLKTAATPTPTPAPTPAVVAAAAPSPSPAPSPSASATATPSAADTLPAATPVVAGTSPSRSTTLAVEAAAVGYVRWSARRFDPVAPGIALSAWTPIRAIDGLSAGGAIGWRHHTGGRTFEEFHGRVAAPYIADIDAMPIEAAARYMRPAGGMVVVAQFGAGLEYATSSYARQDMLPRRIRESDWAPTLSSSAGVQLPVAGGTLGVRSGVRFARHAFAAHDFELLHGVETTAAWQRAF